MASINTVLGPLDVEKLGFTLMHGHVAIASAGVRQSYPELYGDRSAGTWPATPDRRVMSGGIDRVCRSV
jgi:predicted metal-dependent phosphotriesterase family hydrolase